jgi:sulfur carrier protein ThiS
MKITMKMIGPLVYAAGFSEKECELPEGTTADQLISMIDLDKTRPKIITRNGRAIHPHEVLEDGDRVVISPIYSGG